MNISKLLKPNVLSFGFAVILSINTTSIWGGVFPFFPANVQTDKLTVTFYLIQLASLMATYACLLVITWFKPKLINKIHILVLCIPLSLGALLLAAGMYLHTHVIPLVILAALLIGFGYAIFICEWQNIFATKSLEKANETIVSGTAYSAIVFLIICLTPQALTAFLLPLVMVPLAGLCLWIAEDNTDKNLLMFKDVPNEHMPVYKNAFHESLPPAICAGSFAFCMGSMRFIAITNQTILNVINILSMITLLIGIFLVLKYITKRNKDVTLMEAYRLFFPLVGVGLLILPFFNETNIIVGIAITYAVFSLVNILVMTHCCHVARISGIHPTAIFSFYECIILALQIIGYLLGYLSGALDGLSSQQLSIVAMTSLFILLIASVTNSNTQELHTQRLDLLMLYSHRGKADISKELLVSQQIAKQQISPSAKSQTDVNVLDRISKQCNKIQETYALSAREKEIMELTARGQTAAFIAESLFISDNTVRTHLKRVYTKLGVHKKQEMLAMIENTQF